MSKDLPNLELLIKLLKMTTATNDGEALVAIRKANEQLAKFGSDWDSLLRGRVTVVADPFAGASTSLREPPRRQSSAPPPPSRPPPPQPPPPPRSQYHKPRPASSTAPPPKSQPTQQQRFTRSQRVRVNPGLNIDDII